MRKQPIDISNSQQEEQTTALLSAQMTMQGLQRCGPWKRTRHSRRRSICLSFFHLKDGLNVSSGQETPQK